MTRLFYISHTCCICRTGILAFCRCRDNVSLALICNNCSSLWQNPEELDAIHALFPPHPGLLEDGDCRWASQTEIELRGWFELIAGELVGEL